MTTSLALRRSNEAVSKRPMLRRLTVFFVCFAMLFGVVAAPALASTQNHSTIEAIDPADFDCGRVGTDDEKSQYPADIAGGHHHHCGHFIAVTDVSIADFARSISLAQRPARAAFLASYSQAPPTEPPSA